jgi:hypothetical protein
MEDAADDIHKKSEAKTIILELIAHVSNEIIRSNYFDTIVKKYKWNRNETKSQFESISSRVGTLPPAGGTEGGEGLDSDSIKLPDWLNEDQREQFLQQGYLPINRKNDKGKPVVGYYSFNQNGKQEITNFTVDPLFHVYAGVESRYLIADKQWMAQSCVGCAGKIHSFNRPVPGIYSKRRQFFNLWW